MLRTEEIKRLYRQRKHLRLQRRCERKKPQDLIKTSKDLESETKTVKSILDLYFGVVSAKSSDAAFRSVAPRHSNSYILLCILQVIIFVKTYPCTTVRSP